MSHHTGVPCGDGRRHRRTDVELFDMAAIGSKVELNVVNIAVVVGGRNGDAAEGRADASLLAPEEIDLFLLEGGASRVDVGEGYKGVDVIGIGHVAYLYGAFIICCR